LFSAITSVHVGRGGVKGRIFSSSLDRTVRIFEIFSKRLLYSVVCSSFVTCVVSNPEETWLFAGTGDGAIIAVDLREAARNTSSDNSILIESDKSQIRMEGHSQPVTALLSLNQGTLLVSASEDGTVRAWDSRSRQCVQTNDLKAPVTALCLAPRFDPAEAREGVNAEQDFVPLLPLKKHCTAAGSERAAPLVRTVCCFEAGAGSLR